MRYRSLNLGIVAAILASISVAGCTVTSARTARGTMFSFTSPVKRVLVMDPDVQLSELTAGGDLELRADWTTAAQGFIVTGIGGHFAKSGAEIVRPMAATPHEVQLAKLHGVVGRTILTAGPLLPNKDQALDWTLGPGTNELRARYGADYALFTYVRDSYTTAGRRAVQILAASVGYSVATAQQFGFVSLIDLRTGNIVWFNRMVSQTGDLRTAEPAQTTVDELLKGIPL